MQIIYSKKRGDLDEQREKQQISKQLSEKQPEQKPKGYSKQKGKLLIKPSCFKNKSDRFIGRFHCF